MNRMVTEGYRKGVYERLPKKRAQHCSVESEEVISTEGPRLLSAYSSPARNWAMQTAIKATDRFPTRPRLPHWRPSRESTNFDSMNRSRCLGLVGGLGVGATVHYYQKLAKAHEARSRTLDIVIAHAEVSRVFEYVQAGDRDGLAGYLNQYIRRMKAAGAEVAAIPAVTPHFCVRELIATSPLPILTIFEPLIQELAARAARRVAVFGTRFVMESSLFGQVPEVEIVKAKPEEMDNIHNTYVELARTGKGSDEQHKNLTALAHTLCRRDGVDFVILAGTDLALLFHESNTDFPCLDCAALHLRAILKELLGETPSGSP
jgi:aspartate racemase